MPDAACDLLILAPRHELGPDFVSWQPAAARGDFQCATDTVFNAWIELFLDEGVAFPFDDDQRLPAALPESLDPFRAIMIDPERMPEFETGPDADRLRTFQRQGGYLFVPPRLRDDPIRMRGRMLRAVATAGLTRRNPALLRRLQAVPDDRLIGHWLRTLPRQAEILIAADAGWAWGDPVAYHLYWPAEAAAEQFDDPRLLEPVWECVRAGLDPVRWPRGIACGKRFALKYGAHAKDAGVLRRLLAEKQGLAPQGAGEARRHWRHNGIAVNMDLEAPAGADPDQPPARVRDNLWVWCETAGSMGDGDAYLSKASGNPVFAECAVRQLLTTHRWNFAPDLGLWYHLGRPTGPDRESAPWGRGNGWFLYGLRGLLEDLPPAHPARPELTAALRAGLEGLLRWQGPHGLWHNVLDATEATSRQDSCTAWMFTSVYARAFWKGWLRDPRIPAMGERAWQGLKTKLWRGLPIAHCSGTPYMVSRQAYLGWPHGKFLGTAPLLAILELQRMRQSA